MANYLVGCDIGTSGTKSVLIDEGGNVLGSKYVEYPLITERPGWAEHDPEWYWDAVADTISESIKQSKVDPKDIKGVSISALSPSCIMVDKDLKPLQFGHIWMDRRGTRETQWIKEHIGDDRVFSLSGNEIDPYYATVKLLWEKNNRPELYKQCYKLQTAADYPCMKLTGRAITDYSNASLIGVAFDIVNKKWDTQLLEELGLDADKFPEAFACDEVIGEVTNEAAKRTGLAPGTPVVAGTVDCNAAWVAGGAIEDGDMSLVMGTAGVLGIIHREPKFTRNMITIVHTSNSKDTYSTVAATTACGSVMRYYRDTFADLERVVAKETGQNIFEYLDSKAEKIPVGSDGLITLPYFMGERTPIWDPIARAMIFGMSLSHTKDHLLRSFLEGASLAMKHNFELIKQSGIKMNLPVRISEGGAKSNLWRQIMVDCLGIQGVYMSGSQGAPVGNAIAAGVGVGVFKDYSVVKDWVQTTDLNNPIPQNMEVYNRLYKIYLNLYQDVRRNYEDLAKATGFH